MKTIILDSTLTSIKVALSSAITTTNPTFVSNYADNSGSGITEGATDGALNGTTDVTVVPAPSGVDRRVVKDITIFNGDTAAVTVIIKYDNNATQRTLVKVTLAVGDTYTTDGTFDSNGNLKQIVGSVSLTTGVTGVLPIANGGTGATTLAGASIATYTGTETLTNKTLTTPVIASISNSGTVTIPTGTDTLVARATTDTLTNKTLTNPTVTNYVETVVAIGTVTTSNTISLTNGTVQTATLTASTACTFTMPTATAGKSFVLLLKQAAATGNGTATFTSVKFGTAGAPTITATAGKMDILTFIADGTNWYGSIAQGYTP